MTYFHKSTNGTRIPFLFGVGCQLSGSQGGGFSDSASRGKGDFPFPHEDRRDVTLWRLYVFFACRGFRKPPGPLKRGRRKAAQGLGLVGSRPVGWQPAGVPLLRGSGVSEIQPKLTCPVGWYLVAASVWCGMPTKRLARRRDFQFRQPGEGRFAIPA